MMFACQSLFEVLHINELIQPASQPYELGTILSILQIEKLTSWLYNGTLPENMVTYLACTLSLNF